MDEVRLVVTLLAALGCGLVAGIFFAYSYSVMGALAKVPPPHGIAVMQSINVVIVNPVFLTVFIGTAVLSVVSVILELVSWSGTGSVFAVVGAVLYIVGSIVVTGGANVPRNNALDRVDPETEDAAKYWAGFLPQWTAWNTVRMLASLLASAAFILALLDY